MRNSTSENTDGDLRRSADGDAVLTSNVANRSDPKGIQNGASSAKTNVVEMINQDNVSQDPNFAPSGKIGNLILAGQLLAH